MCKFSGEREINRVCLVTNKCNSFVEESPTSTKNKILPRKYLFLCALCLTWRDTNCDDFNTTCSIRIRTMNKIKNTKWTYYYWQKEREREKVDYSYKGFWNIKNSSQMSYRNGHLPNRKNVMNTNTEAWKQVSKTPIKYGNLYGTKFPKNVTF